MSAVYDPHVLVLLEHPTASPELLAALRSRADLGRATFHVLVPNPARAEWSLSHPERHERIADALRRLEAELPVLEDAAGAPVAVSVSIRHDLFEAIEETMLHEQVDEVIVACDPHGVSERLHHDVAHRLAHLHVPVTSVRVPALAGRRPR